VQRERRSVGAHTSVRDGVLHQRVQHTRGQPHFVDRTIDAKRQRHLACQFDEIQLRALVRAKPGGEHGAVQGPPFARGLAHLPARHADAGHRGVAGHDPPGQAEQQQGEPPGEGA
jgi:hypothetical protein